MNTSEENSIIWEKWYDPYGLDDNIIEESHTDPVYDFVEEFSGELDEESINAINEEIEEINEKKYKGEIRVITTPMGIIPLNDNTASNKIFNFWTGHTNFDITANIFKIIEDVEGVETLDVFTRYRLRIAVGKAFDDSIVMRNINKKLYRELSDV